MTISRPALSRLRLMVALDRRRQELKAAVAHVAQAEAEVAQLSDRLVERQQFDQAILDAIDAGIVTATGGGEITFVNRAARNLLDIAVGRGGHVCDLFNLRSTPEELLGVASRRHLAFPLVTHSGEELDLEVSICADDNRAGYFFVFRDVREEKRQSAERERFERLAAIGTMVAGFAHEVRNPVAALRSLAESLGEELADQGIELPHPSRMLQVLERIERLVRTSLQFGRPAAPRRGRHQPAAIIEAAINETSSRTRELADRLRVEIEPLLPSVYVDDAQIVQVMVILINNALDAVASPRRVLVRAAFGSSSRVYLEVHDDGPGIAAEIVGRVFDPFFTTKPSGTGLGLSIAQQIVSENGGAIELSSSRGGTTFVVKVPIADQPSLSSGGIDEPGRKGSWIP